MSGLCYARARNCEGALLTCLDELGGGRERGGNVRVVHSISIVLDFTDAPISLGRKLRQTIDEV